VAGGTAADDREFGADREGSLANRASTRSGNEAFIMIVPFLKARLEDAPGRQAFV
jgi:hypothetical protein